MGETILLRRGTSANLPDLQEGEPGFATDTKKLYIGTDIGTAEGAIEIGGCGEIDALSYLPNTYTQASIEAALTAIGTTNKVTLLLRPGNWVILTALAFPANVTVNMPAGAYFSGAGADEITFLGNSILYPEWWGVAAGGVAATNSAGLANCISCAKITGATVFFSVGTYKLSTYFPIRQDIVVAIEDFNGITITGAGKAAIIETDAADGCDVFQFNGVKNVTVKSVGVHSHIGGGATSGSNAFSFTNGSMNITVQNNYVYTMPFVDTGAILDGGKAFTIQQTGTLEFSNIRILDNVAEGGSYGLNYDITYETTQPLPAGIRFHGNTLSNFYQGFIFQGSSTGADDWLFPGMNIEVSANKFIDCQYGTSAARAVGVNIFGNTISTTDGPTWAYASFDTTGTVSANMLACHSCNFVSNFVYHSGCDYYMNVGGVLTTGQAQSDNCSITGNSFSGAAAAGGVQIISAGGAEVTLSQFVGNTFQGVTGLEYGVAAKTGVLRNTIIGKEDNIIAGATGVQKMLVSGAIVYPIVELYNASSHIEATLAAPTSGQRLTIYATSTEGHTVKCAAGVTFDGINNTAAIGTSGQCLDLIAITATRWLILTNIGTVTFSST
jgi:hypothetical protein